MPLLDRIFRRMERKHRKTASAMHRPNNAENESTEDANTRYTAVVEDSREPTSTAAGVTVSESPGGFFSNSSNPVFNQPVNMTDMSGSSATVINNLVDKSTTIHNIDQGKPVLEALSQEMTQGADVDSSARHPPPKCYPGTRTSLTAKIQNWLLDDHRTRDLLWLYGPAGVGKSAVAQTIAEYAQDRNRPGAAFFFSKTNGRNNPQPVFITLAYQLAVRFPGYLPLVAKELGADPDLLKKAPHVQFRRLIVKPLSSLPAHPKHIIILDGLDECDGETAQLHIVELINNAVLSQISLPIVWMICSRPEPHLMRTFSRPDFSIECWREELAIDTEESRDDAARFIRSRFKEVHDRYVDCVEEDVRGVWPPEKDVMQIIDEASGLFVFASTVLTYIEDTGSGNPDARLSEVLSVIRHSRAIGPRSPMEVLDQLYTRILSEVPEDVWPVTHRLLKILVYMPKYPGLEHRKPRFLCNFFGIPRSGFYVAMRKLHSVLDIPIPEEADVRPLRFLHASFRDYLVQPTRSGRFCISPPPDFTEAQKACLRFIGSPAVFLIESARQRTGALRPLIPTLDQTHAYQALGQCLAWPFHDFELTRTLAMELVEVAQYYIFSSYNTFQTQESQHHELKSMLRTFDYNSLTFARVNQGSGIGSGLRQFVSWVKKTSLHDLVRTHSLSETDDRLLSHLKSAGGKMNLNVNMPASKKKKQVFLLGYETNAILVLLDSWGSTPRYYSAKSALEIWPSLAGLLGDSSINGAQSEPIVITEYLS